MGHLDVVKLLVSRGAEVDLQNAVGGTALMLAAENGNINTVWMLLRAGADPEARNEHNMTALQHAKVMGHTGTAQLLRRAMKAIAPPAPPVLADSTPEAMLGRRVCIVGLPELNGRHGKAARWDGDKGCLDIVLEGGARVVMVKPTNLRLVEKSQVEEAEPAAGGGAGAAAVANGQSNEGAARRGMLSILAGGGQTSRSKRAGSAEKAKTAQADLLVGTPAFALLGHGPMPGGS